MSGSKCRRSNFSCELPSDQVRGNLKGFRATYAMACASMMDGMASMALAGYVKNTFIHIPFDEELQLVTRRCQSEPDLLSCETSCMALGEYATGSTMTSGSGHSEQSVCTSTSGALPSDIPEADPSKDSQETEIQSDSFVVDQANTTEMELALQMHQQGRCTPCWFHALGDGCAAGNACGLCHHCSVEEARQARRSAGLFESVLPRLGLSFGFLKDAKN